MLCLSGFELYSRWVPLSCTFDIFIPFSPAVQLHFLHEGNIGRKQIPQYRNKKWQIQKCGVQNRRNTDSASIHVTCLFVSSSFLPKIKLSHCKKTYKTSHCINRNIEKSGNWMQRQFYSRLNIRNCVIIYKLFITFEAYLFCADCAA